jgi:Skp family chaperone for outer membrane proteins
MNQPRVTFLGLLAGLVAVTSLTTFTPAANAQAAAPAAAPSSHVGVVNLRLVYAQLQETVDSQHSLQGMQDALDLRVKRDKEDLEAKQQKITQTTKPGTDAHEEAMADFDKTSLEYQLDEQGMKVKMVRAQGKQLVQAYTEIQAAVADMAKKKGLDLVLVTGGQDVPANAMDIANPETLGNLVFGRNVLYAADKVDLSSELIATLDAAYKTAKPAAAPGH